MKFHCFYVVFVVFVVAVAVALCACDDARDDGCDDDSDCAPATCCHAVDAVLAADAPDCSAEICTAEFVPCTTDDANVRAICSWGNCVIDRAPWCPIVDACG